MKKLLIAACLALPLPAYADQASPTEVDIQAARLATYALECSMRSMEWFNVIQRATQLDLDQLSDQAQNAAYHQINHVPLPPVTAESCHHAEDSDLMKQLDQFVIEQNNH